MSGHQQRFRIAIYMELGKLSGFGTVTVADLLVMDARCDRSDGNGTDPYLLVQTTSRMGLSFPAIVKYPMAEVQLIGTNSRNETFREFVCRVAKDLAREIMVQRYKDSLRVL